MQHLFNVRAGPLFEGLSPLCLNHKDFGPKNRSWTTKNLDHSTMAMLGKSNVFHDADSSSITRGEIFSGGCDFSVLSPSWTVKEGKRVKKVQDNIELNYYYGAGTKETELHFRGSLAELLVSCEEISGLKIIGFDTESFKGREGPETQLIQIATGTTALLVHRSSPLFRSTILKELLENSRGLPIIFVGAALGGII